MFYNNCYYLNITSGQEYLIKTNKHLEVDAFIIQAETGSIA